METFFIFMLLGFIFLISGFITRYDLKNKGVYLSKGNIVLFAFMSIIVSIGLMADRMWMYVLLFPYLIIAFFINKKACSLTGEDNCKTTYISKTLAEFFIGTGCGSCIVIAILGVFIFYFIEKSKK